MLDDVGCVSYRRFMGILSSSNEHGKTDASNVSWIMQTFGVFVSLDNKEPLRLAGSESSMQNSITEAEECRRQDQLNIAAAASHIR